MKMESPAPTATPLDATTLAAIRTAMAAAQGGRLQDAVRTARDALDRGGDRIALNALLGMLLLRLGDPAAAVAPLEQAHAARPSDSRVAANFAEALIGRGDFRRALEVASADLAFGDPTLHLARLRAYAAQMAEDFPSAVEAYAFVVRAAPDDWESLNNLGNARIATGDLPGAIQALQRSRELNPEAAPTHLNLARALRRSSEWDQAEAVLRAMAQRFPEDTYGLKDLHDLLKQRGRPESELLAVLQEAVTRDATDVKLLLATARQQVLLLDMPAAESTYRNVLRLDESNDEAFIGLATVYEHTRPDEFDALAAEARSRGIHPGTAALVEAFAHRRAKRHAEGLSALAAVPETMEPARRAELLGQFHEGLGHIDEAFAAYSWMNRIQAEDPSEPLERAAKIRSGLRDRLARTTAEWLDSWSPALEPDYPAPIFLVGFPRSGTTLLDTMLMGHPDLAVMEERPALSMVAQEAGGFDSLGDWNEDQIRKAQQRYLEEARRYVPVGRGTTVVDKSPLLLSSVPIAYRIFPSARFILALRHPADALLSCFVSNFRLNSSMANFLRLDTAAEFYDLTFQTWEKARSVIPLDVQTVVYEDLVVDTEGQLRRLSEGLRLPWHGDMLDHQATAARRGVITTASYAQVTEPIYRRSVGRWQKFRRHLEPVLPQLAPWAEQFGYSLDEG